MGSQGNKKINKKEKDTITERERQKYLNSKINFCNPQLLKKNQKKQQHYYKYLFENDKENCRAIRRAVKKSTTQSVKLIIIHHSPYCWW